MNTSFLLLNSMTYWLMIALWSFILIFYLRQLRSKRLKNRFIFILLTILAIDAFRTLFEHVYFGVWYTSLAVFLPEDIQTYLVRPEMTIIPKLINVMAAIVVISILLRWWIPQQEREKEHLEQLVNERSLELVKANQQLQREIAERKQVEVALHQAKESYYSLIANMPVGLFRTTCGFEGYFITVNPAMATMLGYPTTESLYALRLSDIYADNYDQQVLLRELLIEGKLLAKELQLKKQDRSLIWGAVTMNIVRDSQNQIAYFDGLIEDITERKRTEQALRESERRYRAIVEDQTTLICRFLADGTLTFVNQAYCHYFNKQPEELIGHKFLPLIPPEDWKIVEANFARLSPKNPLVSVEHRVILDNGDIRWQRWTDHLICDERGQAAEYQAVGMDITEQKCAEAGLKQAKEEAESANRAKTEFLANMSHEIRTPLNSVIGFSDLLSALVTEEKQKSYLISIKTAGKSLLTLINDILDLSKIEAGKLDIHYSAVNLRLIFDELRQIFSLKLTEKGLTLNLDFDETLPILKLDESRLRQVLLNLMGNAVKFTESGYIKLSANKIYTNYGQNKLTLCIAVEDSGIGISANQQELIFESFRQQDGQSTRKYGGTGLGLAISKRLIEMMNGYIRVKSQVGQGSLFEIILETVDILPTPTVKMLSDASVSRVLSFEPARVLVVDDVESNRELLKAWLSETNLEVVEAEEGRQALQIVQHYPPDLILMDLKMPILDGYEATRRLRSNPTTQKIPVIALTASVKINHTATPADRVHFDDCLYKPINMHDFFATLSRYLKPIQQQVKTGTDTIQAVNKSLMPSDISKLPELTDKLNTDILPIWQEIREVMEMDSIEHFAQAVMQLGQDYHIPGLVYYADNLHGFAQHFDIERLEENLKAFPRIVETLVKIKGQPHEEKIACVDC